ncbi:uncharacterized protein JN550_004783 [Neoarthrinium moseri]|uniref:uncharacterized protein n=1 Tax=Neoarthrinium moseri TaxID=1658444 RepID=UPI001FDDD83D|nr:uncharacterized protein JN550_004783 [Neoarthrinium moseri]KAI1871338.1 hypothetical protein JN550_004783 [Neoarthrinium moseri]
MNSLPLLGKLSGTVIVGPNTEKLGHKWTMFVTCCIQIIGAIIQVTSHNVPQFTIGCFLVNLVVALVENVVPTYQSEIAPAPLRGFFVGSIQLCLSFGSLIAGVVNEAMSSKFDDMGWRVSTALQALPAVVIICLFYFTPNSPRWLVFNDRSDEALAILKRVRAKRDRDLGIPELEIAAMRKDGSSGKREKGPWIDLIKGTNRRRLAIACGIMSFQQLTGVTFSSSYGPTFYKSVGLGANAFVYAVINNAVSVVTALMVMILMDTKSNPTMSDSNGVVAGMILYNAILYMTLGPGAYITVAEIGTQTLREKTMAVSTAVNGVVGFVVVFVTPYLLTEIGAGLGYIWGGFAFLCSIWVWFVMPELKGRSLEEIEQLFENKMPAWRFHKHETEGLSHDLAALESGKATAKQLEEIEVAAKVDDV